MLNSFFCLVNIHKNALMFENDSSEIKIIFPDMKASIILDLSDENLTLSSLVEKNSKFLEKDSVLTHSYLDSDGLEISGNTKASLLFRLDHFKISINRGERVYTCYNFNYLANKKLTQSTDTLPNEFYSLIEKDMKKNKVPFHISYLIKKHSKAYKSLTTSNTGKIIFTHLFENILNFKYYPMQSFQKKLEIDKDRRVYKMLNLFFYATLSQTILLNLCVFVFFNWDIMEPITQLITYINIICGYYYWAYSNGGDYEISFITAWLKTRTLFFKSLKTSIDEKKDVENFYKNRKTE